jgi:hypothetical protein
MHTKDDLNCSRGYEWDVLTQAKQRNPAIKTYGYVESSQDNADIIDKL